jgi:hypothetical protein
MSEGMTARRRAGILPYLALLLGVVVMLVTHYLAR